MTKKNNISAQLEGSPVPKSSGDGHDGAMPFTPGCSRVGGEGGERGGDCNNNGDAAALCIIPGLFRQIRNGSGRGVDTPLQQQPQQQQQIGHNKLSVPGKRPRDNSMPDGVGLNSVGSRGGRRRNHRSAASRLERSKEQNRLSSRKARLRSKNEEIALRQEMQNMQAFRFMVEEGPDMMSIHTMNHRAPFVYASSAFQRIAGIRPRDVCGHALTDIIALEDQRVVQEALVKIIIKYRMLTSNGSLLFVETSFRTSDECFICVSRVVNDNRDSSPQGVCASSCASGECIGYGDNTINSCVSQVVNDNRNSSLQVVLLASALSSGVSGSVSSTSSGGGEHPVHDDDAIKSSSGKDNDGYTNDSGKGMLLSCSGSGCGGQKGSIPTESQAPAENIKSSGNSEDCNDVGRDDGLLKMADGGRKDGAMETMPHIGRATTWSGSGVGPAKGGMV